jgi:GT2 family glycosyltransferase
MNHRILIGSPIHQKPKILQEFLDSLANLEASECEIFYVFVDDNKELESSQMLQAFAERIPNALVIESNILGFSRQDYVCDDNFHQWNETLFWKVAAFKDAIISMAIEENSDYLFLVDSDLVLHPQTLKHLISTQKQIISEIFWTQWTPDAPYLPQVWWSDTYNLVPQERWEKLSEAESTARFENFLAQLRQPGIYEVGGLGACTLIHKDALSAGVSFAEISNLSFWGEDRHFCIRAVALGFSLFVDTHYPAYHIYRESELAGVKEFKGVS